MTTTPSTNGVIQPPATDRQIGVHLVTITLDSVDEIVTELLETAEHHMTVAPDLSQQMVVLAIRIMEETADWLRRVTSA